VCTRTMHSQWTPGAINLGFYAWPIVNATISEPYVCIKSRWNDDDDQTRSRRSGRPKSTSAAFISAL